MQTISGGHEKSCRESEQGQCRLLTRHGVVYNHERPHSKLGYRTPEEFVETLQQEGKKQADLSQKIAETLA